MLMMMIVIKTRVTLTNCNTSKSNMNKHTSAPHTTVIVSIKRIKLSIQVLVSFIRRMGINFERDKHKINVLKISMIEQTEKGLFLS